MTPSERAVRRLEIEALRYEAIDLDRKYPTFRGAVVVARRNGRATWPGPINRPPAGWTSPLTRYSAIPFNHTDDPDSPPTPILGNLSVDDLELAYFGRDDGEFVSLAIRVAKLGINVPGVARFGGFTPDQLWEADERLRVFLAAFATRTVGGSIYRAIISPFEEKGFEFASGDGAALLDPENEAGGRPFVVWIDRGLFAALGEMLLAAEAELLDASEADAVDGKSSQSTPGSEVPPSKGISPGKLKEPSEQAIQCWRLRFIKGDTRKQEDIGKEVYGKPGKQSQVSKDLIEVSAWVAAGNVLPGFNELSPMKVTPRDPSKLDEIPRSDRRRKLNGPKSE